MFGGEGRFKIERRSGGSLLLLLTFHLAAADANRLMVAVRISPAIGDLGVENRWPWPKYGHWQHCPVMLSRFGFRVAGGGRKHRRLTESRYDSVVCAVAGIS